MLHPTPVNTSRDAVLRQRNGSAMLQRMAGRRAHLIAQGAAAGAAALLAAVRHVEEHVRLEEHVRVEGRHRRLQHRLPVQHLGQHEPGCCWSSDNLGDDAARTERFAKIPGEERTANKQISASSRARTSGQAAIACCAQLSICILLTSSSRPPCKTGATQEQTHAWDAHPSSRRPP